MTFVFFLPDLLSGSHFWISAVAALLGEVRHAAGAAFGLILLLAMASAVTVALWQAIYRTVLVWLHSR